MSSSESESKKRAPPPSDQPYTDILELEPKKPRPTLQKAKKAGAKKKAKKPAAAQPPRIDVLLHLKPIAKPGDLVQHMITNAPDQEEVIYQPTRLIKAADKKKEDKKARREAAKQFLDLEAENSGEASSDEEEDLGAEADNADIDEMKVSLNILLESETLWKYWNFKWGVHLCKCKDLGTLLSLVGEEGEIRACLMHSSYSLSCLTHSWALYLYNKYDHYGDAEDEDPYECEPLSNIISATDTLASVILKCNNKTKLL